MAEILYLNFQNHSNHLNICIQTICFQTNVTINDLLTLPFQVNLRQTNQDQKSKTIYLLTDYNKYRQLLSLTFIGEYECKRLRWLDKDKWSEPKLNVFPIKCKNKGKAAYIWPKIILKTESFIN